LVNINIEIEAKADLKQIQEYISKDSIYYANKTINEIINKTEYLLMFPYMGRKIPEFDNTNFRELIYKSYRILYKVNSNIYILNVFHHSRDFLNSVNIINN
jgi:toxin ParE1/3/4